MSEEIYRYAIQRRNLFIVLVIIILFSLLRPAMPKSHMSKSKISKTYVAPTNTKSNSNTNRIIGVDVSHYDGVISWDKVSENGVAFAYIKATQGTNYVDPRYKINTESIIATSILHGAYHFFMPQHDADKQATHFLNTVKEGHSLLPVLDVEITGGVSPEVIQQGALTWLTLIENKTGCKPIIYTNHYFWNEYLNESFSHYPLWIADYADSLVLPEGVDSWVIWQRSETGRIAGISTNVDRDILNGGSEVLEKLKCNWSEK